MGSADSLKLGSDTYDAVVSGLVLNFIPDGNQAVSEMKHVTNSGGVVAAYVWDYAGRMELLRHFWDAAISLDSQATLLDEGKRFPLSNREALRDLFIAQGLHNVDVQSIDVQTHINDVQDYWNPFLSGQGPAPSYVASLTTEQRSNLREMIRSALPVSPEGGIDLVARAWAVRGYS